MNNSLSFTRFKLLGLLTLALMLCVSTVPAQVETKQNETQKEEKKEEKKAQQNTQISESKVTTGEQVAEASIFFYGGFGGRELLDRIRKTTVERGKVAITNPDGTVDNAIYERWIIRSPKIDKERVRLDQEFPNTKFSLIYNGEKTFGMFNNTSFTPKEDSTKAFHNQIWHGLEALLRYKENESKVNLVGREKITGVEYFIVDVTDKQERKTRFYVSAKSWRVMMLEYEEGGVKYKRKFYDYNYSQGTLVPYRTVLWADDKQIEETKILTITFGQRVEDNVFSES